MKRIALLTAVAAIAASTGVASAHHQAGHGANKGFTGIKDGCVLIIGGPQITVGEMMQTLRTRDDGVSGNPKQVVDGYPGSGWNNVGDLIADKCGSPS
jgi:hypothetical protein